MGVKIPFLTLIEETNEIGEPQLSGRFGKACLVGRVQGVTAEGGRIWAMALAENDSQSRERVRFYRERKRRDGNG